LGRLEGKLIMITSGPTRAYLDSIRYITNKSTGRLGSLLAHEALKEGAEVAFIYGKGSMKPSPKWGKRIRMIEVETVGEVAELVRNELSSRDYFAMIHSMAVLDFEPVERVEGKVGKELGEWVIRLVRTPKVIDIVKGISPKTVLVGFKLEYGLDEGSLIEEAIKTMKRSGADLILANDMKSIEAGRHIGYLLDRDRGLIGRFYGKRAIAKGIIEELGRRG
jgi:phosphopantothenoylcysteine synthetase/decarboxylase